MQLDPKLRFDNFIVGSSNRLAVAAAHAVAEAPGTAYNPLFVYSGSGLGKTHLMSAIGNQVAQRRPSLTVAAVTLDEFVGELHAAIGDGGGRSTRSKRATSASASCSSTTSSFSPRAKRRRASCCASSTRSRATDGRSS